MTDLLVTIVKVIYSKHSYHVFEAQLSNGRRVSIACSLTVPPTVRDGVRFRLFGDWRIHDIYGEQYFFEYFDTLEAEVKREAMCAFANKLRDLYESQNLN
ncbi:hypothetical protein [Vibrio breoganii]|uniref:hypothetical protein n=1 Tax=Vibrio breoganii TaxID=553239 RepID=UPI000C836093|nr:hypothetical protein [Vibrio breoganii]PML91991.1 hypothetical protein BCT64_16790 [Vibrio breoganii]PMN63328.1 hypothetical protein BCT28_09400 [Vibrio breoganii]